MSSQARGKALACLAASMLLVGAYLGLAKALLPVFPIFLLAGLRFGVAAVATLGWLPTKRSSRLGLTPGVIGLLAMQALLGNVLFTVLLVLGLARSSTLAAGIVLAGTPAAVAMLAHVVLRESVSSGARWGALCATVGVALLNLSQPGEGDAGSGWGVLLLVAAVFWEASYTIIGRQVVRTLSAPHATALVNLWSLVFVVPPALWQASDFAFDSVGASSWALLVVYSLAASVVSVWLWMQGLRSVGASEAGVFTAFIPVSATLVGVLWLGERVNTWTWFALVLAVLGILGPFVASLAKLAK